MTTAAGSRRRIETVRKVPAAALRFRTGQLHFGQFAAQADGSVPAAAPVHIVLRSGEPVQHPYWGPCVHDFSGMLSHKETYPLDFCHNPQELIGQFGAIDTSKGQLEAAGQVQPFTATDRASEILARQASGTPYEASVAFDPNSVKLEYLDRDQVASVNGRQVSGPMTIFRQWELRGGALCPAGADKYAHAEFTAEGEGEFSIPIFTSEEPMSTLTTPAAAPSPSVATPAAAPAAAGQQAAPVAVPAAVETQPVAPVAVTSPAAYDRKAEGAKFTAAFGPAGAAFFAEGLSFEEAQGKFTAVLRAENEDLRKRLGGAALAGAAQQAAGGMSFGEAAPVSSEPAEGGAEAGKLTAIQQRYGKNVGAFIAGIQMPKGTPASN